MLRLIFKALICIARGMFTKIYKFCKFHIIWRKTDSYFPTKIIYIIYMTFQFFLIAIRLKNTICFLTGTKNIYIYIYLIFYHRAKISKRFLYKAQISLSLAKKTLKNIRLDRKKGLLAVQTVSFENSKLSALWNWLE